MSNSINQHYVPQFILKNFAKGNKTFVFDKQKVVSYSKSVRSVCSSDYFYDVSLLDILKSQPQITEELNRCELKTELVSKEDLIKQTFLTCDDGLTLLESKSGEVIKKVLESETLETLTLDEKANLCLFVAVQYLRTNSIRDQMKQFTEIRTKFIKSLKSTDEHFMNSLGDYIKKADEKDIDLSVKVSSIQSLEENVAEFGIILSQKSIFLLKNTSSENFYISDNPVVLWNNNDFGVYGNLGLLCRGIEIYMPLSSTITLAFFCPSHLPPINALSSNNAAALEKYEIMTKGKAMFCTRENAIFLNHLQVKSSKRYLCKIDNNFNLVKMMIAKNPAFKKCCYGFSKD